jgi:hypothetical protein
MLKQHDDFIRKIKKQIKDDERFIGILAGGSMINNMMDQFSDLDLILVYDSTFQNSILKNRLQIASEFGHLLSGFTGGACR